MSDSAEDKQYLDALSLLLSGMNCFERREYDAAIERYTTAMKLTTKHPDTFLNLRADAHKEKGDHALALADYDKTIEVNPGNVRAHMGRADLYERMGDRARAIADFRKALALNPDMLPHFVKECEDALKRLATMH